MAGARDEVAARCDTSGTCMRLCVEHGPRVVSLELDSSRACGSWASREQGGVMVRRRAYAVGLVVAVVAAAAGGAYAASRGRPTITVCVHKANGPLYQASSCHKGDSTLTWNVRGPVGKAGEKGRNGRTGATGPT